MFIITIITVIVFTLIISSSLSDFACSLWIRVSILLLWLQKLTVLKIFIYISPYSLILMRFFFALIINIFWVFITITIIVIVFIILSNSSFLSYYLCLFRCLPSFPFGFFLIFIINNFRIILKTKCPSLLFLLILLFSFINPITVNIYFLCQFIYFSFIVSFANSASQSCHFLWSHPIIKISQKSKDLTDIYIFTSTVPECEQKGQSKTLSTLGAAFFITLVFLLFLFPILII